MRDRLLVAPLLSLYWWLRNYSLKTPADLRVEAALWSLGGHPDMARICRLRAEGIDRREPLEQRLDTLALVGTVLLLAFAVLYMAAQIVRWAL
jgi:hypothetical protein